MQIFEDQKQELIKLSKKVTKGNKTPMQELVRQALDQQGLCNKEMIAV